MLTKRQFDLLPKHIRSTMIADSNWVYRLSDQTESLVEKRRELSLEIATLERHISANRNLRRKLQTKAYQTDGYIPDPNKRDQYLKRKGKTELLKFIEDHPAIINSSIYEEEEDKLTFVLDIVTRPCFSSLEDEPKSLVSAMYAKLRLEPYYRNSVKVTFIFENKKWMLHATPQKDYGPLSPTPPRLPVNPHIHTFNCWGSWLAVIQQAPTPQAAIENTIKAIGSVNYDEGEQWLSLRSIDVTKVDLWYVHPDEGSTQAEQTYHSIIQAWDAFDKETLEAICEDCPVQVYTCRFGTGKQPAVNRDLRILGCQDCNNVGPQRCGCCPLHHYLDQRN